MIIGIDLGTTNSLAAHLTDDGPALIPNALGEVLTPSVVGVDTTGELLVGRVAQEFQVTHPDRCAATFKRHMGTDWSCRLGKKQFNAVELSGLVLKSLKQDAEAFLGESVDQAVVTVPAYFNEAQRQATIRAGRMAGFDVARILNEPTAAAIAYGAHEADEERIVLVFDLGGGTFDVSIVDQFDGALEIRASSGETFLGGEDFTNTLAARVLESSGYVFERAELEYPKMVARLRKECESAKQRLSHSDTATIRFPAEDGGLSEDGSRVEVKREQFREWTERILNRTEIPVRRALGDANLKRADINQVILVGGATRMPAVVEQVAGQFGIEPRASLDPDQVVGLGAAIQAGLIARDASLKDLVVTDVAPFTLGIEVSRSMGGRDQDGYFLPIINRNTTIPVSRVERVATRLPNQTEVRIQLYQGESRRVDGNLLLGEFSIDGIPRGPAGQSVDVRFTYDLNGVLEAEATVVETGRKVSHLVTRYAKGLSSHEIAIAVRELEALKTLPRDETVNRFLLRRAERVFEELSLEQRQLLDMLMSGFEDALEMQDKDSIVRHREALEEFLGRYDSDSTDDGHLNEYDS